MEDRPDKMDELLDSIEDQDELDMTEGDIIPPSTEICTVYQISQDIEKGIGQLAAKEFLDFAVFNKLPSNPGILEGFLRDRKDRLSQVCCMKLMEARNVV